VDQVQLLARLVVRMVVVVVGEPVQRETATVLVVLVHLV
jgi:hypothetical protein